MQSYVGWFQGSDLLFLCSSIPRSSESIPFGAKLVAKLKGPIQIWMEFACLSPVAQPPPSSSSPVATWDNISAPAFASRVSQMPTALVSHLLLQWGEELGACVWSGLANWGSACQGLLWDHVLWQCWLQHKRLLPQPLLCNCRSCWAVRGILGG